MGFAMKKIIYFISGCVFLILGLIGLALPVIPQVPFLILSVMFFARASQRLRSWMEKRFSNMELYRKAADTADKYIKW